MFLLVAPLVPVLGTAGAYGRDADPAHELTVVSPYSGAKLILLRTLGVVSTCVPLAIGVGLLLTGPVWLSVAWLGPALAGVLIALALASMMDALFASACVAVVWATVVTVVSLDADAADLVRADVQPVFVGLALIAALVVVLRRRSFELLESRS